MYNEALSEVQAYVIAAMASENYELPALMYSTVHILHGQESIAYVHRGIERSSSVCKHCNGLGNYVLPVPTTRRSVI